MSDERFWYSQKPLSLFFSCQILTALWFIVALVAVSNAVIDQATS